MVVEAQVADAEGECADAVLMWCVVWSKIFLDDAVGGSARGGKSGDCAVSGVLVEMYAALESHRCR